MLDAAIIALGLKRDECAVTRCTGGDINDAWRVSPRGRSPVFVKTSPRPLSRVFELEADGLRALREATDAGQEGIRVPEVLGVGESFLALEWIPAGRGPDAGARLGTGLARLHRHTWSRFGWPEDNYIGSLPQLNGPVEGATCAAFFAERRLMPQAELLGGSVARRIESLCGRLEELIPDEPPALLHGDLWGGNWTSDADGKPWIYDPAVHYGGREAELSFTRLFGGFPRSFYDAYRATWPLQPGFDDRVDLWNLYPLLVHANLFGGGYAGRVDAIVRRYS